MLPECQILLTAVQQVLKAPAIVKFRFPKDYFSEFLIMTEQFYNNKIRMKFERNIQRLWI